MDDDLRRRLIPGSSLLDEPRGREPVVPRDLHVRAPVGADGTAACDLCSERFAIDKLNVTAHGYRCDACIAKAIRDAGPAELDDKAIKVGRGRWWIWPLVIAAVSPLIIVFPAATFVIVFVVALVLLRLFLRRGL
jgi:hypothetical protein